MKHYGYIRLKRIIQWSGLTTNAFAVKIGMKRAENLYRIIRSKGNISIPLANLIIKTFPRINLNWLLYGIGEMIRREEFSLENYHSIPVYGINQESPLSYINIPIFKKAEFAVMYSSDNSMEPLIPPNSIIILNTPADIIIYGQLYYVETAMFSLARIVQKNENSDDIILLQSVNKNYNDIIITKNDIVNFHQICGVITSLVNPCNNEFFSI